MSENYGDLTIREVLLTYSDEQLSFADTMVKTAFARSIHGKAGDKSIYKSFNSEQRKVLYFLVSRAMNGNLDVLPSQIVERSDD